MCRLRLQSLSKVLFQLPHSDMTLLSHLLPPSLLWISKMKNSCLNFFSDAKYPNKNSEVLKANQNDFIHVQFKINSDSPYVTALVRLKNPKYRSATGTIIAKQTKDTNIFNAVIDLGDPVILQENF